MLTKSLSPKRSWPPEYTKKNFGYKYFKISLQIYIIVVRKQKNPLKPRYVHFFFALKKDNFLLYIMATALVTQYIMQRKTTFY